MSILFPPRERVFKVLLTLSALAKANAPSLPNSLKLIFNSSRAVLSLSKAFAKAIIPVSPI